MVRLSVVMLQIRSERTAGVGGREASVAAETMRRARRYAGQMTLGADMAMVAALVGEPARASMLAELLDGRALTAGELARASGVTPPTASEHLARLTEARLLTRAVQGRHRYYRLA